MWFAEQQYQPTATGLLRPDSRAVGCAGFIAMLLRDQNRLSGFTYIQYVAYYNNRDLIESDTQMDSTAALIHPSPLFLNSSYILRALRQRGT